MFMELTATFFFYIDGWKVTSYENCLLGYLTTILSWILCKWGFSWRKWSLSLKENTVKYEALKRKMKRSFACDYHKSSISRFKHITLWAFVKVYIPYLMLSFFFLFTLGLVTNNNQDVIKSHLQCSVKRLGTEITDRWTTTSFTC